MVWRCVLDVNVSSNSVLLLKYLNREFVEFSAALYGEIGRLFFFLVFFANSWVERREREERNKSQKQDIKKRRGGQRGVQQERRWRRPMQRWHRWKSIKAAALGAWRRRSAGRPRPGWHSAVMPLLCANPRSARPPGTTQTSRHFQRPLELPSERRRNVRRQRAEPKARQVRPWVGLRTLVCFHRWEEIKYISCGTMQTVLL